MHSRRITRGTMLVALPLLFSLVFSLVVQTRTANAASLLQLSSDPFTNSSSQHKTEVEPDTFSFGTTIVAAFQTGRVFNGGSSDIGWATSNNNGQTWTNGFLPGTTTFATPPGSFSAISDASVAFDAKHNTWLIFSLGLAGNQTLVVSRSTDNGHTWSNPVTVTSGSLDKNWIVCDNTSTSPFFGHCYAEWDNTGSGDLLQMSTSSNGGLTWGSSRATASNNHGLGGQPLVQPNGTVIVPYQSTASNSIRAFMSTNGGTSWNGAVIISTFNDHGISGLRTEPLPSAEIDSSGKVYVVWQDCRFESGCASNDIVMSTSTNGTSWSAVSRIPIDAVGSGIDHVIPGLAVDKATPIPGGSAHLALAFYFCSSTCQLQVGFVSSLDGGTTWTTKNTLTSTPMSLNWIANTSQGRMVGDYISTSFSNGRAFPVFAVATMPSGSVFNEAMFTIVGGLTLTHGTLKVGADRILSTSKSTLGSHTAR